MVIKNYIDTLIKVLHDFTGIKLVDGFYCELCVLCADLDWFRIRVEKNKFIAHVYSLQTCE